MIPLSRLLSNARLPRLALLWLLLGAGLRAALPLDSVIFGDTGSETAHALSPVLAVAATGPAGTSLNQPYRYLTPKTPLDIYGGEMSFQLAVDPARRNYFSVKLWGGDDNGADSGRLYVYVTLNGTDYQLGYRHEGDHMANLSNGGSASSLPGRFFYSTVLLPLWMTQGQSALTFKIISSGRIYTLGSGYEGDGGNYQFNMQANSRGVYRAYTHVEPCLEPAGEVQGAAPTPAVKPQSGATTYLGSGGSFYNAVKGQINNRLGGTPSLGNSLYYPDGVEFLAYSYFTSGQINGSQTALPGYQNAAVVTRVRDLLDLYATNHYANPGQVSAFGNLGWGGAYGALGYAIHLLQAQLAADLDVTVDYGAAGGSRTRRQAWGDLLYASREYGRMNRDDRAITNQCLLSDENIYKANKGLLALGDARAFTEAAAQRYLREGLGLDPWLGSDLAAGGSSQPHGTAYYQVTAKGLSREWGFVGSNYGEMQRMASRFYRLTGETAFRDQAVKMLKARAPFRRPNFEVSGSSSYAAMVVTGFLAWRGAGESDGNGYAGEIAYGDRSGALAGLLTAAATGDATAMGYAKQMLADRQFFSSLDDSASEYDTLNALDVFADYVTVNNAADPGFRLPMTEGQPDFAWADEESGIVALKHGGERLWIAPYWQAKTGTGINGVARFHYSNGTWDQIGTMETTPRFSLGGFYTRAGYIDKPETNFYVPPAPPLNAYAGEKLPLGPTPAGASSDAPFRGKADFYAFRFGHYLLGMNRSAGQAFPLKTPNGFASATDLFTNTIASGAVTVPAAGTVALYLDSATDAEPVPATPLWLDVTVGASGPELSWAPASGATGYTVRRATAPGGPYATLATGVTSTTYTDSDAITGVTCYYTVAATNAHGESCPSHENSLIAASGAGILSFNFAPASDSTMGATDKAGAPGVRASRWNKFSGGTLSSGIVNAGGTAVSGLSATLVNGNSAGIYDRGGTTGDEASLFRTVFDKFDGGNATLTVTGIPYATYDVYFYVYGDENTTGANDRGGSFAVGGTTYYIRTGTATRLTGAGGYLRSADTSFGTGMDVDLGNYVRFDNLSGALTATFTARNINGGAQRLKVAGFQIVGRTAAAPSGLAAAGGVRQAALSWSAVTGSGLSYNVRRATATGGPYVTVATGLAGTAFTDTGLADGTAYYYLVTTTNAAGQGLPSAEVSVTTAPAAPAALTALPGDARVDLSWTAAVTATGYTVKRATVSGGPYSTLVSGLSSPGHADTTAANGVTYYYVVTATNAAGESGASAEVSAEPQPVLATPSGLAATAGLNQVALTWDAVPGATSYVVRRAGTAAGPFVAVASGLAGTACTDTGLPAAVPVYYVVAASNAVYLSADSAPVSVTPYGPPAAPAGLAALASTGQVALSWNAAAGATGYTVLRATASGGPYTVLAAGQAGTAFVDLTAANGLAYYYTVIASNAHGSSALAAEAPAIGQRASGIVSFNLRPSGNTVMTAAHLAGAPGVRVANWNGFTGPTSTTGSVATLNAGIVNAASAPLSGITVTLTGGTSGGTNDRLGSAGDDLSMFRTVFDQFNGTPSTLSVTGLPFPGYDVYFYVFGDESAANANDRGGSFTVGATTTYIRTGTATKVTATDGSGYLRSTGTANAGLSTALGNYVRFDGLSGDLAASFVALNINGGALRLKLSGFQISGRPPAAPSGLGAVAGDGQAALSWNASAHATTYTIKRAGSAAGPFAVVATGVSGTAYTDVGLSNGVSYFYAVDAAGLAGEGADSAVVSATPVQPLPAAPTGLVATAGDAQVSLVWNAVPGASSYAVRRATVSGGAYMTVASGLASPAYTDTDLSNGTACYYVVTASNPAGEGPASAEASATPLSALTAWRLARFGVSASAGIAADEADADQDGVSNLLEYALNGEPLDPASAPRPALQASAGVLAFHFTRIADPELVYTVERSGDLVSWIAVWTSTGGENVAGPVTVEEPLPGPAGARVFLRLRVER